MCWSSTAGTARMSTFVIYLSLYLILAQYASIPELEIDHLANKRRLIRV